ncbi:MAG: DUF2878 domain-containing protein [Pseudomonadota bacterium]|nr:DUF2878 domain-containing protein [Pseudomonadota bacterium]
MPTPPTLLVNFILFQCAWFAAVLGAAHGRPLLGTACVFAAIAFHVAASARPGVELRFVGSVCLAGFVAESVVAMQGHIAYPSGQPVAWLAPYWIVALWGLLATAPNVTLRWLKRRPALVALLGAVLGPMSFVAGVRLGGARLVDPTTALVTMALMGAVLMPALMWLSTQLDGTAMHGPAAGRTS